MNDTIFHAFHDELEKISAYKFLKAKFQQPLRVERPPSKDGKGDLNQLTAATVGPEVRRRYGKKAPRYAQQFEDLAVASKHQLEAAGRDPHKLRVIFGGPPGESSYDSWKNTVRMGNLTRGIYAHELGHAEQMASKNPKLDLRRFKTENPKDVVYDLEVDASRRAFRAGKTSGTSGGISDALTAAALGTYNEGASKKSRKTDEAVQSAARRDPRYKRQLRRAKRAQDIAGRFGVREKELHESRYEAERKAVAAENRRLAEQFDRGVPEADIEYRPYGAIEEVNKKIDDKARKLRAGRARANALRRRSEGRVKDANPFVDKSLYRKMNKAERAVLQDEISEYAERIDYEFGPGKAKLYRDEVQKALRNQTGGSVGDFLRRINSKAFLRRIR
jgi:hypothetical protein